MAVFQMTHALEIAALVLLFCLSAFFSGSETLLFSLTGVLRARPIHSD